MNKLIVRFQESQAYDVQEDAEVVQFMATTNKGSYWARVFLEGPRALRRDRERFKELVVGYIEAGANPCEIEMGEETEK